MSTLINGDTLNDTITISKQSGTVVTFDTDGKYIPKDIQMTLNVSGGSATTPAATITTNPTITVSDTGLITASYSGSASVTPTVSAGYVSTGTAGTVSVSGSNTYQLSHATVAEIETYFGLASQSAAS